MEYASWSVGARTEGSTHSVYPFMRKAGQSLGVRSLTWEGFNSTAVAQGAEVTDAVARNILVWGVVAIAEAALSAAGSAPAGSTFFVTLEVAPTRAVTSGLRKQLDIPKERHHSLAYWKRS